MGLTSDPTDPRLGHGPDPVDGPQVGQSEVYLVLSAGELARGFVRPVRTAYWHEACGGVTTMARPIAETYAAKPDYYTATYCTTCRQHRPVGADGEFFWCDPDNPETQSALRQSKVGT